MSNRLQILLLTTLFAFTLNSLDYRTSIEKALLFFDAQRSGVLPSSNSISWRSNAAVDDGLVEGVDLSGGWFVDGYHFKFNFPMAASVTLLALNALENKSTLTSLNIWDKVLDTLKWPLDYFVKCHVSDNEFYAQCGDPIDGEFEWEKLESHPTTPRKCFKIDAQHPGSDLAGEVAAAMALSSKVFAASNAAYSTTLLTHATALYNFAKNYRGLFYKNVPGGSSYYPSTNYTDELVLAAISLYIATNNPNYLSEAQGFWSSLADEATPYYQNYDDKSVLATLLLAKYSTNSDKKSAYLNYANEYFNNWTNDRKKLDNKLILVEFNQSLRYSLYSAAVANFAYANFADSEINNRSAVYQTAKAQFEFVMDHNSRNYMVGFNSNSPKRPHHMMSSCPVSGTCGSQYIETSNNNINELTGAILSGPTNDGIFNDDRENLYTNSVGVDINAAYLYGTVSILKKEGLFYKGDGVAVDTNSSCASELRRWDMCQDSWWKTQCAETCCTNTCRTDIQYNENYQAIDYETTEKCIYMKNSGKCSENWWEYVCQKTCGNYKRDACYDKCYTAPAPAPEVVCQDDPSVNCTQYKSWDMCKESYFRSHCQKTCCVCECPTTFVAVDYDANCVANASWACNQSYWKYMCQKTCNAASLNSCKTCSQ